MKQVYLLITFLFLFSFSQAQIVDITNVFFKNALVNTNSADFDGDGNFDGDVDTNNDGQIQVSEAEAVLGLNVSARTISSLEGINAFVNLQVLKCETNLLTTLDLTNLIYLEELLCTNNNLTTLNVSNLSNLTNLRCGGNDLTSIDFSGLTNLTNLVCSNNPLNSLDLSGLTNLEALNCSNNQLTTLDLSPTPNLTSLTCTSNELTSLDLSPVPNLTVLLCYINQLTSLDLSPVPNLNHLSCSNNQFVSLDTSPLTNLEFLNCGFNQLVALDVSSLINLEYLNCESNQLTTLDLSSLPNITSFRCTNNLLTSLFIKNGSQFPYNTSLEFSQNPNMEFICVDEFELAYTLSKVATYGYENCSVNSYCSFVPGGEYFIIQGESILDIDFNGCDINDISFPGLKLNVDNGMDTGIFISNGTGNYTIPVQQGSHTITPIVENPAYWTIAPSNFTVDFPEDTTPYVQDICITPTGMYDDLEIILIPEETARPGFDTDYKIVYKNKGTTTLSGSVELAFQDDLMDYVSATPVPDTQSTGMLGWNFTNLEPFESRVVDVTMNINAPTDTPPVNGDDVLTFTATVSYSGTEETPDDNTSVLNQTVVNSYDPNDITCLEGATIAPEKVGEYVHYLIRFENTGTAEAINIVVKDEIDLSKFDISTLVPLDGSHDYFTRIREGNSVEFIFEDINLPFDDANNDGYVLFKIKTLETLQLGDVFTSEANIYFDYNFPILTNTASTEVAEPLSVGDFNNNTVKVYPNPTKDNLTISTTGLIQNVRINDINGRTVLNQTGSNNSTLESDLSNLSKGMYFVTIQTDLGNETVKVVKQ